MTSSDSKPQLKPHSLARDSVGTILTNGVLFLLGIIIWVAIARFLGPVWRGALAIVMITPTLVLRIGTLGFDQGMVVIGGKEKKTLSPLTRTGIVLGLLIGLFFIGILMGFMYGFEKTFWRICQEFWMPVPFLLISLSYPLHLMTIAYDSAIYAENRIAARNTKEIVVNIVMLLVFLGMVIFFDLLLLGVILAYVLANVVSLIYSWMLVRGRIDLSGPLDFISAGRAVKLGFPIYLAQLAAYLMLPTMMVLLSISLPGRAYENLARIAFFVMAYQMIERTLLITRSVAFALLPKITDTTEHLAGELAAKASRHTVIASIVIFGMLTLFMHPIISILLGDRFLPIAGAFSIMAPGGVALSLAGVWSAHLLARQRPFQVAKAGILGVLTALILAWLGFANLPPGREVLIASVSVTIGTFVNAGVLLPAFCRTGNISYVRAIIPLVSDFRDWQRIPGFIMEVLRRNKPPAD
jgi:O-antigen/teichoic acid export membrane protein